MENFIFCAVFFVIDIQICQKFQGDYYSDHKSVLSKINLM